MSASILATSSLKADLNGMNQMKRNLALWYGMGCAGAVETQIQQQSQTMTIR